MIITSIYDDTIVYDTDEKTICGDKVEHYWLSNGETFYEDSDANFRRLSDLHKGITPYRIIETKNGWLFGMNGARWDGLYRWRSEGGAK